MALLDDFNRADENPLSGGGNWAAFDQGFTQNLQLVSNAVKGTHATNRSFRGYTAISAQFGDFSIKVPTRPAPGGVVIIEMSNNINNAGTSGGYRFEAIMGGNWTIYKKAGGNYTVLAAVTDPSMADGDILGFSIQSGLKAVFLNGIAIGLSTTDTTQDTSTNKSPVLGITGNTGILDDFRSDIPIVNADSGIIGTITVPSATDIFARTDATIVPTNTTPSALEQAPSTIDAGTIGSITTPITTYEVKGLLFTDTETVPGVTTPSGTDQKALWYADSATIGVATTASFASFGEVGFVDAATVRTSSGIYVTGGVLPGSVETFIGPAGFFGPFDVDNGAIP